MRAAGRVTEIRRVACEWGIDGAVHLARTCGIIVVIDVLSFSTAVDVATRRGALVFPYGRHDAALEGAFGA
jgi:2-phosphosulfolactate phosphatase